MKIQLMRINVRLLRNILNLLLFLLINTLGYTQSTQFQYLQEPFPGRQHYFASSGDIDKNRAVICGVHTYLNRSMDKGAAYVYQLGEDGKWSLNRTMFPKTSSWRDRFGQDACAISGDYVLVGDWRNQEQKCGAAYIFKLDQDTLWHQMAKLIPKDTTALTGFGVEVDLSGKTAIIGSYKGLYIFELNSNNEWQEIQTINKQNGFAYTDITIDGDYMAVSAIYEDYADKKNIGAVYLYKKTKSKKWKLFQRIVPPPEEQESELEFGNSISIYKKTIAIGIQTMDMGEIGSSGMVYIYQIDSKKKKVILRQKIHAKDFSYNSYNFGHKVAINDDFLIVSRAQEIDHKTSVYFFANVNGQYIEQNKIISPNQKLTNSGEFGKSAFALSGNNALIGMSDDEYCDEEDGACGSAYFYTVEKRTQKKETAYVPSYLTKRQIKSKMRKHKADSILFDYINEDDVYLLRNKKTQLWGMFQSGKVIIPMEYEEIKFYAWDDRFTFVKKNGKWGIYYGGFGTEELPNVSCIYDELKKLSYKDLVYVAAKKDGKWSWVNWYDGNSTYDNKTYYQELQVYKNWNPGDYSEENFNLYYNR